MANSNLLPVERPQTQTPLLDSKDEQEEEEEEVEFTDTNLRLTINRLETVLCFMGFHQSSSLALFLSWIVFLVVGILIPVLILEETSCPKCTKYLISSVEYPILVFQASLAATFLLCISRNLRAHGLQQFLFVDREHRQMVRFHKEYTEKIQDFFRLLILCTLPCFLVKIALEVVRDVHIHETMWKSMVTIIASVTSWTYLTTIPLLACLLFNLVCNLQIIHFDDYAKRLDSDSDVSLFLEEHMILRHHLSEISHRFRIYLILELLLVTASQLFTLFQTTGDHRIINTINGGNFVVISIAQVVGIVISLHAAAKFSHRAQGIASIASRWNALVTCNDTGTSQSRVSNSVEDVEASIPVGSISPNVTGNDLESLATVMISTNAQISSYNKRQSLVMYLHSNLGGVTIFGMTIDRALIGTVFFLELSLVSFVLGKTILLTTK